MHVIACRSSFHLSKLELLHINDALLEVGHMRLFAAPVRNHLVVVQLQLPLLGQQGCSVSFQLLDTPRIDLSAMI